MTTTNFVTRISSKGVEEVPVSEHNAQLVSAAQDALSKLSHDKNLNPIRNSLSSHLESGALIDSKILQSTADYIQNKIHGKAGQVACSLDEYPHYANVSSALNNIKAMGQGLCTEANTREVK